MKDNCVDTLAYECITCLGGCHNRKCKIPAHFSSIGKLQLPFKHIKTQSSVFVSHWKQYTLTKRALDTQQYRFVPQEFSPFRQTRHWKFVLCGECLDTSNTDSSLTCVHSCGQLLEWKFKTIYVQIIAILFHYYSSSMRFLLLLLLLMKSKESTQHNL